MVNIINFERGEFFFLDDTKKGLTGEIFGVYLILENNIHPNNNAGTNVKQAKRKSQV